VAAARDNDERVDFVDDCTPSDFKDASQRQSILRWLPMRHRGPSSYDRRRHAHDDLRHCLAQPWLERGVVGEGRQGVISAVPGLRFRCR
jgi:hypothetical protein